MNHAVNKESRTRNICKKLLTALISYIKHRPHVTMYETYEQHPAVLRNFPVESGTYYICKKKNFDVNRVQNPDVLSRIVLYTIK